MNAKPDPPFIGHTPMVPFSVSKQPLRAIWHMAGFLGPQVSVFEIRDAAGAGSDLLIRDAGLGAAVADVLGGAAVVLMRGHGSVAVGDSIAQAVHRAVFAELNAQAQILAGQLGEYAVLTPEECFAAAESNYGQIRRAWEIWRTEAIASRA